MNWTDLPIGYYAVAISDDESEAIGYQVFRRKRTGVSAVATYCVPGADTDMVHREACSFAELVYLVAQDPAWYREEYGRFAGKCGCCGRRLTDPESKVRGIGPECEAKTR
ncbi:MAG TPA: DUF6011 domain-containing protein [Kribbellaceae bacterium]|nr:DUF6011 domain-containing protein [Kribbellaceae bacterium]